MPKRAPASRWRATENASREYAASPRRPPGVYVAIKRFLRSCDVETVVSVEGARRAGELRARARRGSAVDAILVAFAEPNGTVLTSDEGDLGALATHARDVTIEVA